MIADLGYGALALAFVFSVYTAVASATGAAGRHSGLVASARNGVWACLGLVTVAGAALLSSLLNSDFSLSYVARYTSSDMAPAYRLSAFWAGNAGSLLLWAWALAAFAGVVAYQTLNRHRELAPYVISITVSILAFFLALMLLVANPFEVLPRPVAEGAGLNPLLVNPGMFFHPLTQLLGYAALAVPFSFAMAALITGRLGGEWLNSVRRWTLVAWLLLTIGILLGAHWAYVVLGWGGYWGWDPVENASLMPWLVATAFLHSAMIQRRRGMLKVWNMLLVITAFALSILGTFLTRSGVLSSVHSFAQSPLGPFLLGFLGLSLAGSLGLLFWRLDALKGEAELESVVSRESSFLLNNLLLVGVAFATFWGTLFPLASEAVRGTKISVGPPFFNQVAAPLMLAVVLLMGLCPLIGWGRASPRNLGRHLLVPGGVSALVAGGLFLIGIRQVVPLIAWSVFGFAALVMVTEWFRGTRARRRSRGENYLRAFLKLLGANRPRYGGFIVHLAVVLIAAGIVGSTFYKAETQAVLSPGETISLQGYTLRYEGISQRRTPSQDIVTATLTVLQGGQPVAVVHPEKYFHRTFKNPVTEVAILSGLWRDLYVILDSSEGDSAAFKIQVNPMVSWIWTGGVVLVVGTTIALWPERRRRRQEAA